MYCKSRVKRQIPIWNIETLFPQTCLGLAALLFQAWSQNQSWKFVAVSCTMLIQKFANDTLAWVWMSQHGFSQRKSIIGGRHFSAWLATPYSRKVLFWAFCKRRRQKHALFGLIMYSTVCFLNGWPQTKCKVTFYTCLWPSFSGSFTWGPWFCSPW